MLRPHPDRSGRRGARPPLGGCSGLGRTQVARQLHADL